MASHDWYRRQTWTEADRANFEAHLARSRDAFHKAQYLRIQAGHLAEAGLHRAAIELLDRLLATYPVRMEVAIAHKQKADSLYALRETEGALSEFRRALWSEREFPNVRTGAWLGFGWIVACESLVDLYDETWRILDEFHNGADPFPVNEYRHCAVRALIAESCGESDKARDFAARALTEAEKLDSGLRYHPNLGLVEVRHRLFQPQLERIAGR